MSVIAAEVPMMGTMRVRAVRSAMQRSTDPGSELRLTRRGRLVFSVLALVLTGSVVLAGGWASADEPGSGRPVGTYTVGAGETLWSIAVGIATPADDVRDVVEELRQMNALPSAGLRAGQQILIPVAS